MQLKLVKDTLAFISENGKETNQTKFLKSTTIFLAELFNVNCVLIDKYSLKRPNIAKTVAFYGNGSFKENSGYKLTNTPCETIINKKLCSYPTNVKNIFPKDDFLARMNIDSYIGIPLWSSKGEPIGLIALMDNKSKSENEVKNIEIVLQIISLSVEKRLEERFYQEEINLKIGKLKIAKEVAEEKEEKFEKLSNLTFEGILIHEMGVAVDFNTSFLKMFGYSHEDLVGKDITNIIYPKKYHKTVAKNRINNTTRAYELEGIRKDGAVFPIEIEARNIDLKNNKVIRVTAYRDLTDRKKAEENLKESEKKYRFLFEYNPQPMWIYDFKTLAFLEVNNAAIQHYGYSREEFLSLTLIDIRPKEDIDALLKNIEKTNRNEYIPASEWLHIKKSGEIINVNIVSHKVTFNNREARHILVNDITASKKAEKELLNATMEIEKSERKFRELFEKSGDAILIIKNGVFVDCNQATLDLLGYKKHEDVLNLQPSELSPEFQPDGLNSQEKTEAIIKIAIEKGSHRFEWWPIKSNGDIFPVEVLLTTIENEPNNIVIHCICRDITASKNAENKLKETQYLLLESQKIAKIGSYELDFSTGLWKSSPALNEIFGIDEQYNRNARVWKDLVHPDDKEMMKAYFKEIIIKNKEPFKKEDYTVKNKEYRIVRNSDKQIRWVLGLGKIEFNNNGTPKRLIGTTQDISEKRKNLEDLIIAKEKAEKSEGNLKNRIKELMGIYALQQLTEKNADSITIYKELVTAIIPKSMQYPDKVYCELEINNNLYSNHKNYRIPKSKNYLSEKVWVNEKQVGDLKVAYLEDLPFIANYEANLIEIVAKKLSAFLERRDLFEKLIKSKEKAEESNKLKTEFIQNMSHEIRTPMNGILGFSELLDNPNLSYEKRKRFIEIIKNSTNQLLHIIDDIMEISVLETKQIKAEENPVCINNLLCELFNIFNIKATIKNTKLVFKNGLSDQESTILTDKNKLNKVLGNLLENALKFTDEGIVELGYKLNKDSEPAELEIFVKDNGIGIKPEKQMLIFERFSQAEKELSKKNGGLGLGLSIAKENAELLGGKISVLSELGEGAAFFVTIPYKPVNLASKIKEEKETVKNNKTYTILVAEDEEVNFMVIEILLEDKIKFPCTIIHAKNGLEAVEFCKNNPEIELVLMDIKMPKMDGHEATRKIKELRPKLPIVAQTAYSSSEEMEKAFLSGCNDFLSKPINKDSLEKILSKYLKEI